MPMKNKYLLSFTTGGLFYQHSLSIANIYMSLNNWEEVYKNIVENNILQARTQSTAKRVGREIINRLKTLTSNELSLLIEKSPIEKKQILFISVCKK